MNQYIKLINAKNGRIQKIDEFTEIDKYKLHKS